MAKNYGTSLHQSSNIHLIIIMYKSYYIYNILNASNLSEKLLTSAVFISFLQPKKLGLN